jgi:cobalt-zinc-cadmium efflux system membrane fusion protein
VRIEVDNRADVLHPGELVDVRLAVGDTGPQLAVPVEAVVTGPTCDGWITITRGLKPGDRYVREGAFALKARLLRSRLGEE